MFLFYFMLRKVQKSFLVSYMFVFGQLYFLFCQLVILYKNVLFCISVI